MNFNAFYKRCSFALVTSPHYLYAWQLTAERQQAIPQPLFVVPLKAGTVQEGKIKNFVSWRAALQQLIVENHWRHATVAFTLPYSLARLKTIYLPKDLPSVDIESAIKQQIQRETLINESHFYVDYAALPSSQADYAHYIYAAAHADYIKAYIDSIIACEMKVAIIDIDILSFIRGIQYAINDQSQTFTLLYLALPYCLCIVIQDAQIVLYETWHADTVQAAINQMHIFFKTNETIRFDKHSHSLIICLPEKDEMAIPTDVRISSHIISYYPALFSKAFCHLQHLSLFDAYTLTGLRLHEGWL